MQQYPKLSVVIPVYNEQAQLREALDRIYALPYPEKQVVLVDDGSIDQTRQVIEQYSHHPSTILLHHPCNRGKGAAIRTGLEHADGEVIIIQDADLEYDPQEILSVIEPIIAGETLVCYGSRFLNSKTCKNMALPNRLANWILAKMVTWLYGYCLTDEATAYKAFHRKALNQITLNCEGFEFCPEITAKFLRKGINIQEVPVTFSARTVQEGKKIGVCDFFVALFTLIKYRFLK